MNTTSATSARAHKSSLRLRSSNFMRDRTTVEPGDERRITDATSQSYKVRATLLGHVHARRAIRRRRCGGVAPHTIDFGRRQVRPPSLTQSASGLTRWLIAVSPSPYGGPVLPAGELC